MDWLQAVILGIVQGLTEFLPVSSTAHLRIVPALMGWNDPGAAFSAVIQIGTLAAVLAYFRQDIHRIGLAWAHSLLGRAVSDKVDARMGWMMIVATLPIVVCGMAFKSQIETTLRSLYVVAVALIALAALLALAEWRVRRQSRRGVPQTQLHDVTWFDALSVGVAQAAALVPGVSRSGVTITAGLFAGMSRETAARFSFLLSLPSVLAAGLFQLYKARAELLSTQHDALALAIATVVSGIVGYWAIAFLLRYLKSHTTLLFIAYRLILGALILYWLSNGRLAAN